MVKPLSITAAISFALGSILGYALQKLELGFISQKSDVAIAAIPKQINLQPKISRRSELEQKYSLCTASNPQPEIFARFDDRQLNDLVYQVCTKNS